MSGFLMIVSKVMWVLIRLATVVSASMLATAVAFFAAQLYSTANVSLSTLIQQFDHCYITTRAAAGKVAAGDLDLFNSAFASACDFLQSGSEFIKRSLIAHGSVIDGMENTALAWAMTSVVVVGTAGSTAALAIGLFKALAASVLLAFGFVLY